MDDEIENCDDKSRKKWVSDFMRHTGITFRIKLGDWEIGQVAEWSGNNPQVINRHYKSVILSDGTWATKKACDAFWAITPESMGLS